MDIKGTEDKINQVDSLLTTITKVLKKHWLILILLLFGFGVYNIWNSEDEEYYEEDTVHVNTVDSLYYDTTYVE